MARAYNGILSMQMKSRCFLGWSELANIALGTKTLCEQNKLRASCNTLDQHQVLRPEGFEAGVQAAITLTPIFNTAPKAAFSWVFHSTTQHFSASRIYTQALNLGRRKTALVLDSRTKQAWLVPFLSLALHLCQRYWQHVGGPSSSSPIPFADLETDGAQAAFSALSGMGNLIVFGTEGEGETLGSLFSRINSNLLQTQRTREPSKDRHIFASELLDLVTEPSKGSPLKKIDIPKTARAWLPLVEKVDCVGVCDNLGLAIQPANPRGRTCSCYELPKGKFYLAAHMRCLDQLAENSGGGFDRIAQGKCRLAKDITWKPGFLPWANCMVNNKHVSFWGEEHEGRILQQVSKKHSDIEWGALVDNPSDESIVNEGVVVFGGEEQPKRREPIKALTAKFDMFMNI
ncbi:unnamed protein product [Clonostachys rosea]|uniref:AMP-dependent synthetase/ligase domain-containing protein n=1 Tax=Bionectria ochroleuca TaxID=29856 RepID=A0ABY6UNU5_BIOOC|nr:unnamed protein product [Clonostachys rosea]